jgi:hypothetical protein
VGFQFEAAQINNNVSIPPQNNEKSQNQNPDLNDLINSIYKNDYGIGINNANPAFNQNNNMQFNNFPGQINSNQPNPNPKANQNQLDDLFNLSKPNSQNNNQGIQIIIFRLSRI